MKEKNKFRVIQNNSFHIYFTFAPVTIHIKMTAIYHRWKFLYDSIMLEFINFTFFNSSYKKLVISRCWFDAMLKNSVLYFGSVFDEFEFGQNTDGILEL